MTGGITTQKKGKGLSALYFLALIPFYQKSFSSPLPKIVSGFNN